MLPEEKIIPNAITIEIPIPSTVARGSNIFFPDVPQIRNRKVCGIVTYDRNTTNQTISGNDVISSANSVFFLVTLSDNVSDLFVKEIPYNFYNALTFMQDLRFFEPPRELSIQKCFLTATSATAGGEFALITIFYL